MCPYAVVKTALRSPRSSEGNANTSPGTLNSKHTVDVVVQRRQSVHTSAAQPVDRPT